jgi:hypothetical protein
LSYFLAYLKRCPGRVPGRDDAGILIREHHRDMTVVQPFDDEGRRSVGIRHPDDEAGPLRAVPDEQPVTYLGLHR